jgi:8-oxo-dGTP pyrophosphatase MutT (NUDIX family)
VEQRPSPDPGDEIVEHVDEHGNVIELVTRRRMRAENLRHRSVAIVVTSSDGRLLIHQRAGHKDLFPGWWDIAAGGVLGPGETYDDAAHRELSEELGIDGELELVGAASYDDEHAREVCRVYRLVHDGPYRFDDGEIDRAMLVTPDELATLRAEHDFLPGSLAMVLPHIAGFADPVRCSAMQRVEFTVEPFVEGQPGRHVTAPVDAVRDLGIEVDFGPFGSECVAETARTPDVVAAIVRAAVANAATHVTIDITAIDR